MTLPHWDMEAYHQSPQSMTIVEILFMVGCTDVKYKYFGSSRDIIYSFIKFSSRKKKVFKEIKICNLIRFKLYLVCGDN